MWILCGQGKGGFSDADSALFGAKISNFFEIYGVSVRTREGGVKPVRTFCGQEKESIFADGFYGRPISYCDNFGTGTYSGVIIRKTLNILTEIKCKHELVCGNYHMLAQARN